MDDLEVLDVLTIISFVMQMKNQISIADIQQFVEELHKHLESQDAQLKQIMEVLNGSNQESV